MKKTTLALVLLLLTLGRGNAQIVHHWNDPRYDWSMVNNQDCICDTGSLPRELTYTFDELVECYTEEEKTIYGLAIPCAYRILDLWIDLPFHIWIFQHHKNQQGIQLLDSASVTPEKILQSTLGDTRLLEYDANIDDFMNDATSFQYGHRIDTIVELFFNHPVLVSDTFLIGFTYERTSIWDFMPTCFIHRREGIFTAASIMGQDWELAPVDQWRWACYYECPLMLPILQPQDSTMLDTITPCPAPNTPELGTREEDRVFIFWDDNPDPSLAQQVAFGTNIAGGPDSNAIVTYRGWFGDFFNYLSPDSTYACWVRNQCRHQCVWHDTLLVWGYWSEPLIFSTRDTVSDTTGGGSDPNEGIAEAGMNPITLHPNPTSGEVRIECGELSISTVELLDLQGRVLEHQEPRNPQSSTLNLQPYPTGTYIIRITTTEGTFTRRVSRR